MKIFHRTFLAVLLFLLGILFFTSCDVTEPTEGLEVRLNTFTRETLVSAYIYDANTLQPIEENLTVRFSGDNSSKIVDETNDLKTEFTAKNGFFIFGVKDGTEFNSASPFKVNAVVKAPDYLMETQNIVIKSGGYQTENFYLTNPDNLPSNSESESFSAGNSDNSGTLMQEVRHTTGGGASVTIKSGTTIRDENGSPVTGELNSQITIIPLTGGNEYNAPLSFNTSGSEIVRPVLKFDFLITDQSGNSVSDFSQSVDFSIPVSDELAGEFNESQKISVWKQNKSGTWIEVGEAALSASLLSGHKQLNLVTDNTLSGTTNSAGTLLFGNAETNCEASLIISNMPSDFNSTLQFFDENGTLLGTCSQSSAALEIPNDGFTISSVRLNAELNDPFNTGIELGKDLSLQCGENNVELNFPEDLISVNIQILGLCTEKEPVVVVNPNISFSYKKEGSSTWHNGNLVNGEAKVTGLESAKYNVTATYRGKTGNAKFDIADSQNIELLEVSNPENLLNSEVDASTTPATLRMEIDIEDECD